MKSKIKSLVFWAAFFFLLTCLMFFGGFVLIVNDILVNEHYIDLIDNVFCAAGYLFITIYVIFAVLIITNKFPEKIRRFQKFKYLVIMFLLLLAEFMNFGSIMYDFD